MIRVFLLLLTALAASWFLADTVKQKGPGYAYIYFDQYSVETSFWVLMLSIVIIVAVLYFGLRLGSYAVRLAIKTAVLPKQFGLKKSRKYHLTAVLAYLEEYWPRADDDMSKALKKVETPFIANLLILQAQLKRGDITAAQASYKQAESCADYDELSLLLAHIDILIAKHELEEAGKYCGNLLREYPFEMRVVLKALKVYQHQGDPVAMEPLIKTATKHHLLTPLEIRQWQQDYYCLRFEQLQKSKDFAGLKKLWRKAYKLHDNVITKAYYKAAAVLTGEDELEKMLRQELRKHFSAELCLSYARINTNRTDGQLSLLESFLSSHGESAALLAALAIAYKNSGQQDKALQHAEQSLAQQATVQAYQILAEIYAVAGDQEKQLDCLHKALDIQC